MEKTMHTIQELLLHQHRRRHPRKQHPRLLQLAQQSGKLVWLLKLQVRLRSRRMHLLP
jgi:hypothetical protein